MSNSSPPHRLELEHRRAEVTAILADAVLAAVGVSAGPEGAPRPRPSRSPPRTPNAPTIATTSPDRPPLSRVRDAKPHELPTVVRLLRGTGPTLADIEQARDSACLVVDARRMGPIAAAYLECHGNLGVLRGVFVMRTWRLRGLGTRLTNEALRRARQRGLAAVYTAALLAPWFLDTLGFALVARDLLPGDVLHLPGIAGREDANVYRLDLAALVSVQARKRHAGQRVAHAIESGEPWWPDEEGKQR
jgi:N-acetylglutamate synthase-like GNAT family acetyltransferase